MARKSSCEEDYIPDAEVLRALEDSRKAFEAGNKSELMRCVYLCAAFQAVIPEWAADALIEIREKMESGRVTDFNEAFGIPTEKINTRAAKARKLKAKPHVLEELWRLRISGSSLNDAEIIPLALENLRARGFNINHRDIKEIYKAAGDFLKKIPRVADPNTNYCFSYASLPKPRRRGRSVLWDEEAG